MCVCVSVRALTLVYLCICSPTYVEMLFKSTPNPTAEKAVAFLDIYHLRDKHQIDDGDGAFP